MLICNKSVRPAELIAAIIKKVCTNDANPRDRDKSQNISSLFDISPRKNPIKMNYISSG